MTSSIDHSKLILLVPCYNPSGDWAQNFIDKFLLFKEVTTKSIVVVLINDGSTIDISLEVKKIHAFLEKDFIYLSLAVNKGKGAALKAGAALYNADKYMFTDIDFPYTVESMRRVYESLVENKGLVIGHRNEAYYESISKIRVFVSKYLRRLNRLMTNLPTDDTQCGLKAFDLKVRDMLLTCSSDRFLIDLELLLKVNSDKTTINAIHVELRDDVHFTKFDSSLLLREAFNFITLIVKYRFLGQ